ncbi:MAG TPA: hypothetical protein VJ783_03250 [Pirellulales bacterium]|nr:hypothetical protein [Pirellulales bacterium]
MKNDTETRRHGDTASSSFAPSPLRPLAHSLAALALCVAIALTGCAQIARGQGILPSNCQILRGPTVPIRYPARPPKQTYANGEASIDHSQFVTRGELQKWTDATKANVQKTADAVNQVNDHSQSVAQSVDELKTATQQNHAGLAGAIADAKQEIEDIKIEIPELVKSPAGAEAKKVAIEVAGQLVTQVAGQQAMPLLQSAALFGGPPAVVAAVGLWLVLRTLKKRLPAIQQVEARLQSFGGAGGAAAADPFQSSAGRNSSSS